jgi:hypothetical protein
MTICRPATGEYDPYFQRYIDLVPPGQVLEIMDRQWNGVSRLIDAVSEEASCYRYLPGKWNVREVLGHMMEVERMLVYWAWCFSRGDLSRRPPVDCAAYVARGRFAERSLGSIGAEFQSVRCGSILFFGSLDGSMLQQVGEAGGGPMSVRALAYIIVGHTQHHRSTLRDLYQLPGDWLELSVSSPIPVSGCGSKA